MKEFMNTFYGHSLCISLVCGLIAFILSFRKIRDLDRPWYIGCLLLASFTPVFNILTAFICCIFAIDAIANTVNRLKAYKRFKRMMKNKK